MQCTRKTVGSHFAVALKVHRQSDGPGAGALLAAGIGACQSDVSCMDTCTTSAISTAKGSGSRMPLL
jgi:hypothetical protein